MDLMVNLHISYIKMNNKKYKKMKLNRFLIIIVLRLLPLAKDKKKL
jgi:hypothetical protein